MPHSSVMCQVEEVLLLWDRVIGLDSLLPIALLAVAVVCFRWGSLCSLGLSSKLLFHWQYFHCCLEASQTPFTYY
jgi:hypothetical protein